MRVLVTGGTGYLGSAIVRALHRQGHEPVVFARTACAAGLPGTAINGDVRDTRAVTAAADGVEAICHTAALVALWRRDPSEFDAVNVGGLQSVLSAVREHRIPRMVYTSSFLALPPADSPHVVTANHYQRTKVAARDVARRAASDGVPVVTLYPGVIYGPGPSTEGNLVARLMRDQLNGKMPGLIGPERLWSFAFVDDVAAAHVSALTAARVSREYVIGGVNAPQRAIYTFVAKERRARIPPTLPRPVAYTAAAAAEIYAAVVRRPPLFTRGVVEIFSHDWSLDSSAATTDLDYRVTPLNDGLARTLETL